MGNTMKPVNKIVHAFLLVLLPGLISVGAGYYYGIPENALIRNTVMLGIGTMCLVFSWLRCGEDGTLDDHNTLHPARFVLCYTAGICLGSLLPFFPVQAWPLVPFALALSLSSNLFLGIFAYGTVVMYAVFLTENTLLVFFLYFLCGGAAILLFRHPGKGFRPGIPLTVTLLYLFTAQMAGAVLYGEAPFSWEMAVLPGINLFITALLLLIVTGCYGFILRRDIRKDGGVAKGTTEPGDAAADAEGVELEDAAMDKEGVKPEDAAADKEGVEPEDAAAAEEDAAPKADDVSPVDVETILMEEMDRRLEQAEEEENTQEPAEDDKEAPPIPHRCVTVRELSVMDGKEESGRNNMSFYIENETEAEFPFHIEEIVETLAREILTSENCPFETHVNVLLTDNEGIRRYNREYRDIDRPTDVLSFPNVDFETPSDFQAAEKDRISCFDPETKELMLGDIIISVDKIREQADAYGHSEKREFAFLVAHSMLHLCGYDHMEPEEASVMKKKQITALRNIGITRDYR